MIRRAKNTARRRARAATVVAALLGGLAAAAAQSAVFAQAQAPDATKTDGRLYGYEKQNPGAGTNDVAATWMIFFFMVVLGCGAMFKASKRLEVV